VGNRFVRWTVQAIMRAPVGVVAQVAGAGPLDPSCGGCTARAWNSRDHDPTCGGNPPAARPRQAPQVGSSPHGAARRPFQPPQLGLALQPGPIRR
jgi:hypothetical protein